MSKAELIAQEVLKAYFDDKDVFKDMSGLSRERAVKAAEMILAADIQLLEEVSQHLGKMKPLEKEIPPKLGYMTLILSVEDRQRLLMDITEENNPEFYRVCKPQ